LSVQGKKEAKPLRKKTQPGAKLGRETNREISAITTSVLRQGGKLPTDMRRKRTEKEAFVKILTTPRRGAEFGRARSIVERGEGGTSKKELKCLKEMDQSGAFGNKEDCFSDWSQISVSKNNYTREEPNGREAKTISTCTKIVSKRRPLAVERGHSIVPPLKRRPAG